MPEDPILEIEVFGLPVYAISILLFEINNIFEIIQCNDMKL